MSTRSSGRTIAIILLSVSLVFIGNGLLQTLLPMRGGLENFSTAMIGLQGTAYFGGFIAGCVFGPGLIKAVGHIRAFAGVVAILAALTLLFPVWIHAYAWVGLRMLTGICLAIRRSVAIGEVSATGVATIASRSTKSSFGVV
jgi:hypothetical protein